MSGSLLEAPSESPNDPKIQSFKLHLKRHLAAIQIQKAVRGWLTRKHVKFLNEQALIIQKYWRGHKSRVKVVEIHQSNYKNIVYKYYHKKAAKIQALWRGYSDRKVFNYYLKKEWLLSVNRTNQEALRLLNAYRASEIDRLNKQVQSEYEPWINYMAIKLHHLIRTKAIPGIYSKKGTWELSDIEQLLANCEYRKFMTGLKRERLVKAIKLLMDSATPDKNPIAENMTKEKCLAALKAAKTISNPCINSTRK